MDLMHLAYQQGHYEEAYNQAMWVVRSASPADKNEAAYMAGLSAYRMKNQGKATPNLLLAARSHDPVLAGDAMTMLGVIYWEQNRHEKAAASFLNAAQHLTNNQDRANAYYYAAKSQQKLKRWAQARNYLILARSHSSDPRFHNRIARELQTTGFTLQTGAYTSQVNAQRAAEALRGKTIPLKLGRPHLVRSSDANRQKIYLVQVGQFSSHATAAAARDKLRPITAIIVPLDGPGQSPPQP